MDSSVETGVRDKWKGWVVTISCAWDLHMHGLRLPMMIAWYKTREYEFGFILVGILSMGLRSRGRQAAKEIWTCDWFRAKLVCV